MYKNIAFKKLKEHEGLKLKPYRCTAGRLTIGYGRNIEDCGITEEEAEYLLLNDMRRVINDLHKIFERFYKFSDNRKAALVDMLFNLGKPRFLNFHNMIKAINEDDWNAASAHALDSFWSKQVGKRSFDIAGMLKRG